MINWFKGLQHPEGFHGKDSRSPYFEGWYHKLVSKTKRSIVIIPGMYRSGEVRNEFSFISHFVLVVLLFIFNIKSSKFLLCKFA